MRFIYQVTVIFLLFSLSISGFFVVRGQGVVPLPVGLENTLPRVDRRAVEAAADRRCIASIDGQESSRFANGGFLSVTLSTPVPRNQGGNGSCVGFAVGYAAASILTYPKCQKWEDAVRSPSYVYNQIRAGIDCDSGAFIIDALQLVTSQGICSYRTMPYVLDRCHVQPTQHQRDEAYQNRIMRWGTLPRHVDTLRWALSQGYPVVVAFRVTRSYHDMLKNGGMWRENNRPKLGDTVYHAVCIVGYNDNMQMFRVMDSKGSNVGDGGFFWVSYDLVRQGVFYEAYMLYGVVPEHKLSGPDMLCTTGIYTVSNLQAGDQVEWETDSSIEIVSGQGTGQLTVRKNPREAGEGLLQAKVNGHSLPWKGVQVGLKAPQIVLYEGFWATYGICVGRDYTLRAYDASGKRLSDVNWEVTMPSGGRNNWDLGMTATRGSGTGGEYNIHASAEGEYAVRCWQPNTECGMGAVAEDWYDGQYCGGGGGFLLTPNPASGLVTMQLPAGDELSLTVESQSQGSSVGRMVRVYSQHAELMYEGAMTDGMQLDVRGWVRGVYTVMVDGRGVQTLVVE